MKHRLYDAAPIPLTWSADEASAVIEFLQEVIASIWLVHGDAIDELMLCREAQYELAFEEVAATTPTP